MRDGCKTDGAPVLRRGGLVEAEGAPKRPFRSGIADCKTFGARYDAHA